MDDRQIIVDNLADELVSVHGMENEFGEKRHYFFFLSKYKTKKIKVHPTSVFIKLLSCFKMSNPGVGGIVLSVKCLLCKYETMVQISSTHTKSHGWQHAPVTSGKEAQRKADP